MKGDWIQNTTEWNRRGLCMPRWHEKNQNQYYKAVLEVLGQNKSIIKQGRMPYNENTKVL